MFRELTRLIEAAGELAAQASAGVESLRGSTSQFWPGGPHSRTAIVDVRTRVAQLRRDAGPATIPHDAPRDAPHDAREPLVDVFNEDTHYVVVAELRGVDQSSVHWHLEDDRLLVIRAESGRRTYYREIRLAAPVDPRSAGESYGNGILELHLWKR
jgi:HSP20 family molecular chaperone IbpA